MRIASSSGRSILSSLVSSSRRLVAAALGLGLVSLAAVGCNGYSLEAAENRCDSELEGRVLVLSEGDRELCVDCYQRCGDQCVIEATTPLEFRCPGDE